MCNMHVQSTYPEYQKLGAWEQDLFSLLDYI